MIRRYFFIALIGLLLGFAGYYGYVKTSIAELDFKYFTADCSIYNIKKELLFNDPDYYCDFSSDGKVLSSMPYESVLRLRDKNDVLIWKSDENVHHDLKFTKDQKAFLAITSEVFQTDGIHVRSDCFSKRDLNNNVLHSWCLSQNLEKLKKIGFKFKPQAISSPVAKKLEHIKFEISHGNSIHEIPENASSSKHPAFKPGNFIINLYTPSYALLIISSDMKEILWHQDMSKVKYGLEYLIISNHDNQVSPDGRILTYANYVTKFADSFFSDTTNKKIVFYPRNSKNTFSTVIKWDPFTSAIDWLYTADPPTSFLSKVLGVVTELKNGNFLLSDITLANSLYVVKAYGKILWRFDMPNIGMEKLASLRKVRPLYDDSFLRQRGIIE